jgi:hypothetical protein
VRPQPTKGRTADYPPRREKALAAAKRPGARLIVPIAIRQTLVWSVYKANPCLSVPPCTRCAGYTLPRRGTRCQTALSDNQGHRDDATRCDPVVSPTYYGGPCYAAAEGDSLDREVTCHAMLSARRGHPGRWLCVSVRSLRRSLLSAAVLCATVSVYVSTAAAVHIISVTTDYDAATRRVSAAASATTAGGCRPGTGSGAT